MSRERFPARNSSRVVIAVAAFSLAACGTPPRGVESGNAAPGIERTDLSTTPEDTVQPVVSISEAASQAIGKRPEVLQGNDEVIKNLRRLEDSAKVIDQTAIFEGGMRFFRLPGEGVDTSWHSDAIKIFTDTNSFPLLVVLEPQGDTSNLLDQEELLSGYFGSLRAAGNNKVTYTVMPEPVAGASTNSWVRPDVEQYAANVEGLSSIIKRADPEAEVAALLDLNGDDISYARALGALESSESGTYDTFVLQAFSNSQWIDFVEGNADLSGYLDLQRAYDYIMAAGNKPTIINTGIPKLDNAVDKVYSAEERSAIATALLNTVIELRNMGVNIIGINLFAADKSISEGRSWDFDVQEAGSVLAPFIVGLHKEGLIATGFSANPEN